MNKKELIWEIVKYMKENDYTIKDFDSEDNYMSEYGPILDIIVSETSNHGIILCDTGGEYYLSYQVSATIDGKYITVVTDNSFESTEIRTVEQLADVMIDNEKRFIDYLNKIKEHDYNGLIDISD